MTKGTTPRHSKSPDPVTIDLDATDVTPRNENLQPQAPGGPKGPTSGSSDSKTSAPAAQPEKAGAEATADSNKSADDEAKTAPSATSVPNSGSRSSDKPATATDTSAGSKPATGATTPPRKEQPGAAFGRTDAKPSKSTSSGSGGLIGGLVGGLIAAGAIYGLQWGGVLPLPGGSETGSVAMADLDARLSALSAKVDGMPVVNDSAAALATLSQRVEAIEQVSGEPASANATALAARVDELAQRLDAISTASPGTGADSALAATIGGLQTEAAATASSLEAIGSKLSGLESSIATLEQKQADAQTAITARLSDAEAKLAKPDANLDVARAIASVGLKAAIDRGGPFAAELDAFASVASDDAAIAGLRDFAASGVPTRSQLLAAFPAAADRMIAAMRPAEPDAGIFDRLMSSAMTMVKVRKVGDVEGDSVEAIVARMETRITDGDLEGALAEWQKLPDPAKAAAGDFGDKLAARAKVDGLLATAVLPSVPATSAK